MRSRTVAPRSYGNWGRLVQRFAAPALAVLLWRAGRGARAAGQDRGVRRFADGRLPARDERRLPGAARTGAQGQRRQRAGRQCRRVRRHRVRRAFAARLVGAGRHRCRDGRAWRQRHAARHRSQGHASRAGADRQPAEAARYRGDAVRHAGGAELWGGLCQGVQRDLSGACLGEQPRLLSVLPGGHRGRCQAQSARRPASDRSRRRHDCHTNHTKG